MCGAEILQYTQAFFEGCLDGSFDDSSVWLRHQAAHAGQLANLIDATAGTGSCHQINGVQVRPDLTRLVLAALLAQLAHHLLSDLVASLCPQLDVAVVALSVGDVSILELTLVLRDFFIRISQHLGLVGRSPQVISCEA